jgi:hypothetical protein
MEVVCLLLSISTILYSADEQKNPKTVTLQCHDDQTVDATLDTIKYFKTIKNMVDDLGTDNPIPLPNISAAIFKCLVILARWNGEEAPSHFELYKNDGTFTFNTPPCPTCNRRDLLTQANYLDVDARLKQLLAIFYAETLKNTKAAIVTYTSGNHTIPSFDLPHDLEPLVAGELLRSMLAYKPSVHIKTKVCSMNPDMHVKPIITTSSHAHGFSCIWEQPIKESRYADAAYECRTAFFDGTIKVKKEKPTTKEKPIISDVIKDIALDDNTRCAVSPDGAHMLIHGRTAQWAAKIAALYYIPYHKRAKLIKADIQKTVLGYNPKELVTLLFNHVHNIFQVITCKKNDDGTQKTVSFYTIDPLKLPPNPTEITPFEIPIADKPRFYADLMSWSCINGDLVGIYTHQGINHALLYKDQKLQGADFNFEKKIWFYYTENGKEKDADFITIPTEIVDATHNLCIAIQRSFVPNFVTLITHTPLDTERKYYDDNTLATCFDPHTLSFHCLSRKGKRSRAVVATTKRPFKRTMIAGLQILNQRWLSDDPKVLIDTYALYHYYLNRKNWHSNCADLKEHISPPMKALFAKKLSDDSCTTS